MSLSTIPPMTFKSLALMTIGFCAGAAAHASTALGVAQSTPARAAIADAPVAVPEMYKVELKNEYVRVVRVRYPAHASGAMHAHPAPGALIVPLTDQDARVKGQDGSTREIHVKAGEVRWAVATPGKDLTTFSAHAEDNLADRPFEILRIEPKLRAPSAAAR
jgi:hypothetical protein